MGKVIINLTMSLDGYTAGPNVRPDEPMGDGGEELHDWMFSGDNGKPEDLEAQLFRGTGAIIMGNRTFELGLEAWGENPPYHVPCFVLSPKPRETITKQGGTSYISVTDGIESALNQAREAAGDKDIVIMGGANAAQQYINASLFDELHIHLAHMLLGGGDRLFDNLAIKPTELEKIDVGDGEGVTHLKFRVRK